MGGGELTEQRRNIALIPYSDDRNNHLVTIYVRARVCVCVYVHMPCRAMCRAATHGSIIVLHMPERGFREWDLDTLERVLVGLEKKGLRSVTLSELEVAAA